MAMVTSGLDHARIREGLRVEMTRRGLGRADIEQRGATVEMFQRELLRLHADQPGVPLSQLVERIVNRLGLAAR